MENHILRPQSLTEKIWLIPCLLNRDTNSFVLLFKPFNTKVNLESQIRNPWEETEDLLLKNLVTKWGVKKWKNISKEINKCIYKNYSIRNSKQCRERWLNHLDSGLIKGQWKILKTFLF